MRLSLASVAVWLGPPRPCGGAGSSGSRRSAGRPGCRQGAGDQRRRARTAANTGRSGSAAWRSGRCRCFGLSWSNTLTSCRCRPNRRFGFSTTRPLLRAQSRAVTERSRPKAGWRQSQYRLPLRTTRRSLSARGARYRIEAQGAVPVARCGRPLPGESASNRPSTPVRSSWTSTALDRMLGLRPASAPGGSGPRANNPCRQLARVLGFIW
jgi:hypothetical protein